MTSALGPAEPDLEAIARDVTAQINDQLGTRILELLRGGYEIHHGPIQLECSLLTADGSPGGARRVRVAAVDIDSSSLAPSRSHSPQGSSSGGHAASSPGRQLRIRSLPSPYDVSSIDVEESRPLKRRKDTGGLRIGGARNSDGSDSTGTARQLAVDNRVFPQRKKRLPENPLLRPSTLDKFTSGVWESIYSGVKLDIHDVIEQWQTIEGSKEPRLLASADQEVALREENSARGSFNRMNILTRKVSQTSRTFRSLEVIVQAHWVQCFDERVAELTGMMPREKAKKAAIGEACVDFNWSEKELRNKMGVWRGYYEIKNTGGWAALVFAGMGLYRFCKYRVSFTDDMFQSLRALRHRFEVAADTLHPRWRQLLTIVNEQTAPQYTGHPHDWVVGGPQHQAIPLPETYSKWDENFSYKHLDHSVVDEDAWGLFDPRMESGSSLPSTDHSTSPKSATDSDRIFTCAVCSARQSDDPRINVCVCFPTLYGSTRAPSQVPVQVFRTPSGKNNGLVACLPFERGYAVGEFVGQVTAGLVGKDVMVGQTSRATYQIWQGKAGNYTRFVNHSCSPNAQFERFVWCGVQRVVLVSRGIEAGDEITVDYTDSYWKNLNKECLCGQPRCRYRRNDRLLPPILSSASAE